MKFKILSIVLPLLLTGCTTYYIPEKQPVLNITKLQDETALLENRFGSGTGIAIYQDSNFAYLLTCRHCVCDNQDKEVARIKVFPTEHNGVETINGVMYNGEVIATSKDLDIALIKVPFRFRSIVKVQHISLPDVGTQIYVASCPYDFNTTFSNGVIASYSFGNPTKIRSTAFIDHGSSGCGLYNVDGSLIGMCQQIYHKDAGIGVFISVNDITEWLKTTNYSFVLK